MERALIDPSKIRDYLLDLDHPIGRSKAALFLSLGYTRVHWTRLAHDLVWHAREYGAYEVQPNAYGLKYMVSGILRGPLGRSALLESVWIILDGEDFPRLVTAYPTSTP